MAYTPTSPEGIALQKLRRMVALSATFQALCEIPNVYAGALERVTYIECRDDLNPAAAVSVIDSGDQQIAGGAGCLTRPMGHLHLYLRVAADLTLPDPEERKLKGIDTLGNIISDIMELSGVDDSGSATSHPNLFMRSTPIIDLPPIEITEKVGEFYWAETSFVYGDG